MATPKGSGSDCAGRLKVLADPTRLAAVEMLMAGPRRVAELHAALDVDQSLLSHHLAVLREHGLVEAERAGKGVLYRLAAAVRLPPQAAAIDLGCCRLSFAAPPARAPVAARPRRARPRGRGAAGLLALAAGLLPVPGCGGEAAARTRLSVTGSSTVAPLVAEIARRFEALHPEARIDVQTGGSGRGIADVRSGVADLGMVSRALRPDESELAACTIAWDGIALIVHATNPVAEPTRAQVAAVYRGEARDWSRLGAPAGPITVVSKAEGRSTLELFLDHFGLAAGAIRADIVIGDNAQGIKIVAGNPRAIGYVSIGAAAVEIAHGAPIRMLPFDGVDPSLAAVRDATFPIRRPLVLVSRGAPEGVARSFVAFAASEAADDLIEAQSFAPPDRRAPATR